MQVSKPFFTNPLATPFLTFRGLSRVSRTDHSHVSPVEPARARHVLGAWVVGGSRPDPVGAGPVAAGRGPGAAARKLGRHVSQVAVQHQQERGVDEGVHERHVQRDLVRDGVSRAARLDQREGEEGPPEQHVGGQDDGEALHAADACERRAGGFGGVVYIVWQEKESVT